MIPTPQTPPAGPTGSVRPPMVDAFDFARRSAVAEGRVEASDLPRVADEQAAPGGGFDWRVAGAPHRDAHGRDRPLLRIAVDGRMRVACARCLEPVDVDVRVERSVALAPDEAAAEAEDLEAEDHDVIAGSARFDLAELVEDEILMVLLTGPKHADCAIPAGVALAPASDDVTDDTAEAGGAAEPRRNPFAVLEQLKKRGE